VDLGIKDSDCYRIYAEMLLDGGIEERSGSVIVQDPDPEKAWEMIEKAIHLDPIDPYNYIQAAGILLAESRLQDIDRAAAMLDLAVAVAGPRDTFIRSMRDFYLSVIEPAREARRALAEQEAELAKADPRNWFVAFLPVDGQPPRPNLENIPTPDLRELIRAGKVTGEDNVYQAWRREDIESKELVPLGNKWDLEWVKLKDVPVFAEDLAAAQAKSGTAPADEVAPDATAGSAPESMPESEPDGARP
jgi:hypothetical protein